MRIEIHGRDLPAIAGHQRVEVGLQCGQEVVQRYPVTVDSTLWHADATVKQTPDDSTDLTGRCIHGRRGDRFLYLSWGTVDDDGAFTMFRRAKLMLAAVDAQTLGTASGPDGVLVAELGLTGPDGTPVCAAVRPPAIAWHATE